MSRTDGSAVTALGARDAGASCARADRAVASNGDAFDAFARADDDASRCERRPTSPSPRGTVEDGVSSVIPRARVAIVNGRDALGKSPKPSRDEPERRDARRDHPRRVSRALVELETTTKEF